MPGAGRTLRPRIEAQMQFALLMELYDKGRGLDTNSRVEAINKFLAVSQPGIEKQIRWGWGGLGLKADRAAWIVEVLRWGLDQFRDGKAFMRSGPPLDGLAFDISKDDFKDGIVWDRSHGRAVRVGSLDPGHVFVTRVFELLTEVSPWLRVCQRAECRRFFLFQRPKQIYCGGQCAQQVRMARFLAQQAPALSGRGKR